MLKIRLKRTGRKNNPSFRIIVTESTKGPKSGQAVDVIGFYDPKLDKREVDTEKAQNWLSNGAKPSDTVHNILVDLGVITGKKINVLPQKSPVVKEEEKKEEVPTSSANQTEEESGNDAEPAPAGEVAEEVSVEEPKAEELAPAEVSAEETLVETPAEENPTTEEK